MKEIKVTVNDDGTFDVDGMPFESVDEAVAAIQESMGGQASMGEEMPEGMATEGSEESASSMAGAPGSELPPAGDEMGEGELPPAGAEGAEGEDEKLKARYAKKKGMRPKESASLEDYFAGAPRA